MAFNPTQALFDLAFEYQALRFGEFELKSGRISPYFFNAGVFADGRSIDELARCYAHTLMAAGVAFDQLFGPAYKGIPLVAAIAMALHRDFGLNVPFIYNRKESKNHGEGGQLVGPPLAGRVIIVDDVISAGTSVQESIGWIEQAGAQASGVIIALDRQEIGQDDCSAVDSLRDQGMSVISVANLDGLIGWAEHKGVADLPAMQTYRKQYGAN